MSCRPRRSIAAPMVVGGAVLTVGRLRCRRFGLLEAVSCVSGGGLLPVTDHRFDQRSVLYALASSCGSSDMPGLHYINMRVPSNFSNSTRI